MSKKLISINSLNRDDSNYRYTMESVVVRTVKKGQYSTTFVTNIKSISDSIKHPLEILFDFLSNDLGTSGDISNFSLNGTHTSEKVQGSIDKYITELVLCKSCKVPEVDPEIQGKNKKAVCIMSCSACGKSNLMNSKNKTIGKAISSIIKYIRNENQEIQGYSWPKHADKYKEIEEAFADLDLNCF